MPLNGDEAENRDLNEAPDVARANAAAAGRAASVRQGASEAEAASHIGCEFSDVCSSHVRSQDDIVLSRPPRAGSDRSQAEQGCTADGRDLASAEALAQENADLQAALAAAHEQIRQLELVLAFPNSRDAQPRGAVSSAAAADQPWHGRAASLSLSDLCDLEGLASQPGRADSSGSPRSSDGTEQRSSRLRECSGPRQRIVWAEKAIAGACLGPVTGFQGKEVEQEERRPGHGWRQRALRLQAEVGKLKQRNLRLQTALIEASLRSARDAAAARQESASLQQQRDRAAAQLMQLRAVAAEAVDKGEVEKGGPKMDLLQEEPVERATRRNDAVEQTAGKFVLPPTPLVPEWFSTPTPPTHA